MPSASAKIAKTTTTAMSGLRASSPIRLLPAKAAMPPMKIPEIPASPRSLVSRSRQSWHALSWPKREYSKARRDRDLRMSSAVSWLPVVSCLHCASVVMVEVLRAVHH
jgi:hypothetical protein